MNVTQSLTAILAASMALSFTSAATAQSSNYYAGQAVGGQSINVDLNSINSASQQSVNFVYYLGSQRRPSQANCQAGTWTTFSDRTVHRPQSQATQNMLDVVCGYLGSNSTSSAGVATVFNPPSNVRANPNGEIICSVRERTTINVYGHSGAWYYTDVCGQTGVIHSSQLRF